MEPYESFGTPQQPADQTPMQGQTSLPFAVPTTAAPNKRGMFAAARKPRRTVVLGLTVVALAATGGVGLAAASNNGTTPAPGAPGTAGSAMHGRGGPIHGEFTVSDGKGGYQTELMQQGTVQSLSAGTLTVKSSDGFTQSYTTDSTTVIGRGRGMRNGGHRMHGQWNGRMRPGIQNGTVQSGPNTTPGTATPPTVALPKVNTVAPNTVAPNTVAPNASAGSSPAAAPGNLATPTEAAAPTLTVGENVLVIAIQSGGTDHAQRVMPMRQAGQNGQKNGNGLGGFGGRQHGGHGRQFFGGGAGQQNGSAPMGTAPMGGAPTGNAPMGNAPMNQSTAPSAAAPTVTSPQSSNSAPADSPDSVSSGTGSDATNG